MKISNKSFFLFFRGLLFVLLLVVVGDFFMAKINGSIGQFFRDYYFGYGALGLILILALIRINFFLYESDYEVISIKSKSLVFGVLGAQNHRYEFPKGILVSYKYKGRLTKQLTLKLKSTNGDIRVKKFNLLFVSNQKIEKLLESLKGIVERNKRLP